jgi:hypothetical protein
VPVPEITAEELVHAAERGDPYQVLDVRPAQYLESGTVDLFPRERLRQHGGLAPHGARRSARGRARSALPVAVVCAQGISSRNAAAFPPRPARLRRRLLAARRHGAVGCSPWCGRELAPPAGFDRLWQFDRVGKGALC